MELFESAVAAEGSDRGLSTVVPSRSLRKVVRLRSMPTGRPEGSWTIARLA
jgi:hypothetical protein